jgi:hypothetical protein
MKKFELVLKNEKVKFYRTISWIIISSNIICLVLLSASDRFEKWGYLFAAVLTFFSIWVSRYFKIAEQQSTFYAPFFLLILAWLNTAYWWVSGVNLIFLLLDTIARRELVVKFFPDKIIYPSWPVKTIKWEELNNLVLKDGLLTIDFKNNKLLQYEIINDENDLDINEKEFNAFCREMININVYKPAN